MLYAIIDIEATGGSPRRDRITEIAVVLYDGKKVIDRFSSLINPETPIPSFINRLTGISDDMVSDAPKFQEVAKRIVEITRDAIFVAHNVQFDYAYVKAEFKRLGYTYSRPQLCTVQLSQQLMPGLLSYGLDNLCSVLDITNANRHRAAGDTDATLELFNYLLSRDHNGYIAQATEDATLFKNLPPTLTAKHIEQLPEEIGIYRFLNEQNEVIYVGKSVDIKRRVLQHFQKYNPQSTNKQWRMLRSLYDINFEETGSELIALLHEAYEIRNLKPKYNRAQNPRKSSYGIFELTNNEGYRQLYVKKVHDDDRPIAVYDKDTHAKAAIATRIEKHRLCQNLCTLKKIPHTTRGNHTCLYWQMSQCNGACIGQEPPETYNERAANAFSDFAFQSPNFLIIGDGRNIHEASVVLIQNNELKGWGYFPKHQINEIYHITQNLQYTVNYNPYINKIIAAYLKKSKYDQIIAF
ncbi:MAG: GIY-YIG nuclease family protein [Sphingobacteriales bacterium]|nr:GIY-YIG nuclease family protein [Sphingobacteriales bacterium]